MTVSGATAPIAVCGWQIAKRLRGKTFVGQVTAAYGGASVTKQFTAKIP